MASALVDTREKLAAKQKELAAIFASKPDLDFTEQEVSDIQARNAELNELGKKLEELKALDAIAQKVAAGQRDMDRPAGMPFPGQPAGEERPAEVKSIGQLFVESAAFKQFDGSKSPVATVDYDVKVLFQTSAGWAPDSMRTGKVVPLAQRSLVVADLPMLTETSQSAVKYMEETTKTDAATEIAEGAAYPEAALALTERSETVRKIAVFLPVTDEQFEDEPRARDYVNGRLTDMLNRRLDGQLLSGNGVAPNLTGYLNKAGIQTQAKGADPAFDAIHKGITLVRFTGFAEPDAIAMHPTDWQNLRLTRTPDGIYILGNPGDQIEPRLWGLPVVVTPAETLGTALVGAYREFSELSLRRGIEFDVSNSHSTFFSEGKLAIRASFRAAFLIYRAAAFCTVTGLPA